jgi:hypothetical protein
MHARRAMGEAKPRAYVDDMEEAMTVALSSPSSALDMAGQLRESDLPR